MSEKHTPNMVEPTLYHLATKEHKARYDALLDACKAMLMTHGMHGPCENLSCKSCVSAYNKTLAAIAQAQKG